MKLNRNVQVLFTACMALATPATADTVTKGLEQTARDVGNGVVGLLNAFGSGKLKPDNIELLSDSKVALSFNGQRFNNPCGIEVFWGDGSSEKFRVEKEAYKTGFTLEHRYDTPQDYKIEINGKVIFRGLKTVVNCPGNFEGTIALVNQAPASPTQPSQAQATQTLSAQSEETLANAEKIRALEAEVAKKQAERIAELEAQLEVQANDEKIKKLENELAEKQAKRIAELEAQLDMKEEVQSETSASNEANDLETETKLTAPILNSTKLVSEPEKPSINPTQTQKTAEKALPAIPTVPMPSLKGKQVSRSSGGDWSHELWCDSRFGKRDRYKSLWRYKGTPARVDKFKAKGKCRPLISPDFTMTNLTRTPQQFPSGDAISGYCDKQLSTPYFKALAKEVEGGLKINSFIKPEFSLLMNVNYATDEQIPVLINYQNYVKKCLTQLTNTTLNKASQQERQIAQRLVREIKNSLSNNFLKLTKKQVSFGEAAELINQTTQQSAGLAQDQTDQLQRARAAAKAQAQRDYWAKQQKIRDKLADDTQRILRETGDRMQNAFKPQNNGFSSFKSNRRRECSLQGKLYINGSCR